MIGNELTIHVIHEWRTGHADPLAHNERIAKIMADIDQINTDLEAVQRDLDTTKSYIASQADRITALNNQLTQLSQSVPPQVDLSGVLATASALKDEADAIVAQFNPGASAPAGAGDAGAPSSDPTGGTASSGTSSGDTSGSSTPADAGSTPSSGDVTPPPTDATGNVGDATSPPTDGAAATDGGSPSSSASDGSQLPDTTPNG